MIILIKIKPKVVEKLYRSQSISPRIILFLLDSICISAYMNFYPICKKKYDTFNNLQSIFGKQKWRNRDANVFKTFFCYEIIEMGINQGRAYFVAECSTTLITESADRRPRDQFPVYPLGWSLAIKLER